MRYNKSPLKWAGSKQKALDNILPIINSFTFEVFAEPFVGAANVSLNIDAKEYLWNDLNEDLVNTYHSIFYDKDTYIVMCKILFSEGFDKYLENRELFNKTPYNTNRAALFQYLNKHGFNGLCRYNRKGLYNVPKGTVTKKPKQVPVEQVETLHKRMYNNTTVSKEGYKSFISKCGERCCDMLIYADPPYVPLTSDFNYTSDGFNKQDHVDLKKYALQCRHPVLISNHWTAFTENLYSDASDTYLFDVQRTISCKGDERKKVKECLVVYN